MPKKPPPPSLQFPKGETLLRLEQIHFARAGKPILQNITLSVCAGEIVTLIGPNGAGKTTTVKIALNLTPPDRGSVHRRPNLRIGYVPQKIATDPTLPLSVNRFLNLSPRSQTTSPAQIQKMLTRTGTTPALLTAPIHSLSGGEMRRVLLARALLQNPDLLILDEPSAGMDINGQTDLYRLLQTIRAQRNCGILLISHDLYMVMAATDRVFCLNRHMCCSGKPQDVRAHPEFVALFGQRAASELAVYQHHHNQTHNHTPSGEIQPPNPKNG